MVEDYIIFGAIFLVDVYCFDPIDYRKLYNERNIKHADKEISKNLMNPSGHVTSFSVHPRVIESLNSMFTEKFVPGLDVAFPLYDIGFRPYLGSPYLVGMAQPVSVSTSSGPRYPLVTKYFSGDVSGVIGESLFLYMASLVYGVSRVVHLRPEKTSLPTADFVVMNPSDIVKLAPLFCGESLHPYIYSRLFVECKSTVNTLMDVNRIEHGLFQLSKMLRIGDYGLLFIVHKDPSSNRFVIKVAPLIER